MVNLRYSCSFISSYTSQCIPLLAGSGINQKGSGGSTALHAACSVGSAECVELLLERMAEVGLVDKNDNTPLHIAAMYTLSSYVMYDIYVTQAWSQSLCEYHSELLQSCLP